MAHPFQSVVYIQVRRRWVSVRVLSWAGGDSRWEGEPRILVSRDTRGKVIVTDPEEYGGIEGVLPRTFCLFDHPRLVVDSLDETSLGVQYLVRRAGLKASLAKPAFIFHFPEPIEGGVADLERHALQTIGSRCGAARTLICEQPYELPAPEILAYAKGKALR